MNEPLPAPPAVCHTETASMASTHHLQDTRDAICKTEDSPSASPERFKGRGKKIPALCTIFKGTYASLHLHPSPRRPTGDRQSHPAPQSPSKGRGAPSPVPRSPRWDMETVLLPKRASL